VSLAVLTLLPAKPATAWSSFIPIGKYDLRFFGTHAKVSANARKLIKGDFPSEKLIYRFEGRSGPDGLWYARRDPDSNHNYNPFTRDGGAVRAAVAHYLLLKSALKEKDMPAAALHASYLSHYIADLMNPPHIIPEGRMRPNAKDITDDYYDPYYDGVPMLKSKHFRIETDATLYYLFRPFPNGAVETDAVQKLRADPEYIAKYLHRKSVRIATKATFNNYLKEGWSRKIRRQVAREIFPEIVSTVATVWQSAVAD
jgi:hypothetical protein